LCCGVVRLLFCPAEVSRSCCSRTPTHIHTRLFTRSVCRALQSWQGPHWLYDCCIAAVAPRRPHGGRRDQAL
jgi:hypothetical protein